MSWNGGIIIKRLNSDSTILLQDQFFDVLHCTNLVKPKFVRVIFLLKDEPEKYQHFAAGVLRSEREL
jgi:hypothetical protein